MKAATIKEKKLIETIDINEAQSDPYVINQIKK